MKFHPGMILPRSLKTEVKFHPGANSVCFQRKPAIIFNPALFCGQCYDYHYFLCLKNWKSLQVAPFGIFLKFTLKSLSKVYFKRTKTWRNKTKKTFFLWKNETLTNWDNQRPGSSPGWSSLKWIVLEPEKLNSFYIPRL